MTKRVAAFPRLLRALAAAAGRHYDAAHVIVPHDPSLAFRRTVRARLNISPGEHAQRMGLVVADMLRDPAVRADLRALLDSYEEAPK